MYLLVPTPNTNLRVGPLVIREFVRERRVAYWVDGRVPQNSTLMQRTSSKKLLNYGINPGYRRYHLTCRTQRCCGFDRYRRFLHLVDVFMSSYGTLDRGVDYKAWLLDPFGDAPHNLCLAHELAQVKMYHKNRKNFRALLLISTYDDPTQVKTRIESLVNATRFATSPCESFKDYSCFERHLDEFLERVTEYASDPVTLGGYVRQAGFRIECNGCKQL